MKTAERIGFALGKAIKKTAAGISENKDAPAPQMYRTNLRDVPKVEGLKRDDGWVDMQVQFLIDKKSAGANHVVGWRSEEHTSELQSRQYLVCRLLLENKNGRSLVAPTLVLRLRRQ